MNKITPKELLEKYRNGTLNEEERTILESWYLQFTKEEKADIDRVQLDRVRVLVFGRLRKTANRKRTSYWAAAAAVLLICGLSYIFQLNQPFSGSSTEQALIVPGSNKAFLILPNGKEIPLVEGETEAALTAAGSGVIVSQDEELVYKPSVVATNGPTEMLTVETPKGGQISVILPDGTKVRLNAATSIRFPTRFSDRARQVEIDGEAYLEVADKPQAPFYVQAKKTTIQVLGTAFNIEAYKDMPFLKTTLVSGAVKVRVGAQSKLLKPMQQAVVQDGSEDLIDIANVDVTLAVGWKDGRFLFDQSNLKAVMSQVSRWYDVEILYKDDVSKETFTGALSKNSPMDKILKAIELTGSVHFKVEGRKIYVMK